MSSSSLSEDEQRVMRRYAESTIGSEIGKIMDSMVQKNFVDFLLKQKEKKSKYVNEISAHRFQVKAFVRLTWSDCCRHRPATAEEDPEVRLYGDLLKLRHEKQKQVCFPFSVFY